VCDAAQTEREARGVGNSVHLVHERCRVVAVSVVLAGWNRTQDVSVTLDVACPSGRTSMSKFGGGKQQWYEALVDLMFARTIC
jgi:hypothetical protein